MKVKELIEKLQACDPEHMVVVDGYEGGVYEADCVETKKIALNAHEEWYYGDHDNDIDRYPNHEHAMAVRIY
jgi:hypothetical protein